MEKSYWYNEWDTSYPKLESDLSSDVVIVGGGLAGLMCAYELLKKGSQVIILEAKKIGLGESGRSSAMISFAHDLIYDRLIKKHGIDVARQYLQCSKSALDKIRGIIEDNNIDCSYSECDMLLFSKSNKGAKKIVKEQKAYSSLGLELELTRNTELPFVIKQALKIDKQAILNPYKFLLGLSNAITQMGGKIYENTLVTTQPKDNSLSINGYTIHAKNFVIASHFPYLNFPGFYFTKMYQHRSHNIVFKSNITLNNIYEEAEDDGFEYRPTMDGIMCGGANIRTGKYKYKSQYRIVEDNIYKNFNVSDNDIISRFSAQDCMTFDYMPFVGRYSNFLDNVYVVTGFNKWGFSNSVVSAEIIASLIYGKDTVNIFDSKRLYLFKSPLKTMANLGELVTDFANLLINADAKKIARVKPEQGAVVKLHGKRLGVYKDENGKLHAISAICPHLGCNLKWNKDEKSWDCPCHGSRYDIAGNILNNPTYKKAEKVKINDEKK